MAKIAIMRRMPGVPVMTDVSVMLDVSVVMDVVMVLMMMPGLRRREGG